MNDVAVRLDLKGSVTLATVNGVTGYGLIRFSPNGEKWQITRVHVECSSRVSEAQARLYLGQVRTDTVIDGTYSGSSGDTTTDSIYLEDGQTLFVEWTGGVNGAVAVVTASGWKSSPQGGFRAVH